MAGRRLVAIALMLSFLSSAARAELLAYDISWTGANGYSLTGGFIFDDAAAADGRIDENELIHFAFMAFLNGSFVGSFNLSDGAHGALNFNFDPVAEAFFTGGKTAGDDGQMWNTGVEAGDHCPGGPGFNSGDHSQILCLDNEFQDETRIPISKSTLLATRRGADAMSEPASAAMFLLGLLELLRTNRRGGGVLEKP